MKLLLLLICFRILSPAILFGDDSIKVMTFNTMCDFCANDKYEQFSKRIEYIKQTVENYLPDLVSLQEVRTSQQARYILSNPMYKVFLTEGIFMSYADPAIAVNIKRFKILKNGQFWLGPSDSLNFGWKFALPRQVHWVKLLELKSKKVLYFIGSHFDNRLENLNGSIKKVHKFIKKLKQPYIFAADSNIAVNFENYPLLLGNEFINSFELVKDFKVLGKEEHTDKDLCYHRKGKRFPDCRVDHVLLSKLDDWEVINWIIDISQFGEKKNFASDHRAIISEIILK